MQKKLWYLAMVAAVLLSAAPVSADGEFYVIAGGGAAVGTKISNLPYTINNPGFYYLTGNLSYSGTSNGITVASDDVTIDLMGFSLIGPGGNNGCGINLFDGTNSHNNVEVRNGTLRGWSSGVSTGNNCFNNRAINLRAENCILAGISLEGAGDANLIKGCTAVGSTWETVGTGIALIGGVVTGNTVTNCTRGIVGSGTINNNFVSKCSLVGIRCIAASSIIGNTVVAIAGTPTGIEITTSSPVMVTQNTASGPGLHFSPGAGTINVANTNAGF
jgi:hypothetical protein